MSPYTILYFLFLVSVMFSVAFTGRTYNVLSYGAVGNGKADDTLAFIKAWNDTCKQAGNPTMIIPNGKIFFVQPINLIGPCKSHVNVELSGKVIAPDDPHDWDGKDQKKWLEIKHVDGINVIGNGVLDGRGDRWWEISCRHSHVKGCSQYAPTIISFSHCKNAKMRGVSTVRSGGAHIAIYHSENVEMWSLKLSSPAMSPNTDGIHISHSRFVSIHNSGIGTGDDCISMIDRTFHINISYVNCGPGHGISIGSLGGKGEEVDVQNITISHVNFHKTTNGGRIKTWQGGNGRVHNVEFSNLNFTDVKNPIIIDQYYNAHKRFPPRIAQSGIHVNEVRYVGIEGTSKTKIAINLNCSEKVPCTNISLENIRLRSTSSREALTSSCNNAHGSAKGFVHPKSCLLR